MTFLHNAGAYEMRTSISVPTVTSTEHLICGSRRHPVTWLLWPRPLLPFRPRKSWGTSYLSIYQLTGRRRLACFVTGFLPSIPGFYSSAVIYPPPTSVFSVLLTELCLNPRSSRNGGIQLLSHKLWNPASPGLSQCSCVTNQFILIFKASY